MLILKSFIRPFIVTFFIVMFVLLMLFLFKYIDDLIGKGFEWYIILELMLYASATNVSMALPLSVLLSSIMTYGNLGENYELVAIKSSGISLTRAMYPMVIVVTLLSISAFIFSDYMLPVVNYKYYSLLYDVRQQKTSFLISEGIFNNSFPEYSIRVKRKDPDGQTLHGLMIYHKNPKNNTNDVIFAQRGVMYRTPNDMYLVIKLQKGVRYEEAPGEPAYNTRQRLTRSRFDSTEQKFDLSGFKMKRTGENEWRSSIQMMNLKLLTYYQDSSIKALNNRVKANYPTLSAQLKYFTLPVKRPKDVKLIAPPKGDIQAGLKPTEKLLAYQNAQHEAENMKGMLRGIAEDYKASSKDIRRFSIEYQKKFTLSAACLALFLIGAPLGAIIRKGGLGLPVVVAVIFFLIYYIIGTIGEKSVKEGGLSPLVGMWISIAVLTPIGLFLSYKAATDSALFDAEPYKRFFQKLAKFRKSGTKQA
nr:LptF/LptG family permease [Mucilaginibacter sp. Bleaf8]